MGQRQYAGHVCKAVGLALGPVFSAIAGMSPVVAADTVPVVIDPAACRALLATPDAGATYRPGVDVRGRPVVPAEGPGGSAAVDLPSADEMAIELRVDLAERLGLTGAKQGLEPKLDLGTLRVRNGIAELNGRPLGGTDQAGLREACRRLGRLNEAAGQGKPTPPAALGK